MSTATAAALVAALLHGAPDASFDTSTTLPGQTVTAASRRAQAVDETLASVTVVTRDDIEASQAVDIVEILRRVPGVDLIRTGGQGQNVTVFLRGSNSNHALVLLDGVRVAASSTGAYAFEHLPVEFVERIEIVRGPRASYYGSDAIGGVIAITTRRQRGPSLALTAGRYQRYGGSVGYGAAGERGDFGVTLGGESLDGFSAALPENFSFDPDHDGYHNRTVAARGRLLLGEHTLGATAIGTDADIEFDQGESALRNHAFGATAQGPVADGWRYAVMLGHAREDLETPAFFNAFETRRANVDALLDWNFDDGQHLLLGVNWQRERGASIDTFSGSPAYEESRHNEAVFASWQGHVARWDWEAAARHDDNSSFGTATTGQAAIGYRLHEDWRVSASYGEGFRAPTLNELYSPGFGGLFAGNPALDPESSRSVELGLDFDRGIHHAGLRVFRTDIDDLIAFEGGEIFQAINVQEARIDGAEIEYGTTLGRWSLDVDATLQDPRNRISDAQLLRRAKRKAGLELARRFDNGAQVGTALDYASERRDVGGARLPAYTLWSVYTTLPLAGAWSLGLRAENLTGRDYELVDGYATPGRSLIATLRYAPGN